MQTTERNVQDPGTSKPQTRRGKNLAGQRFGRLVALEPTGEKKNGYAIWRCRCDCGGEICAPSRYLKNGWTTNCGCVEKEKRYWDLTGRRFGKLVVTNVAMETLPDGTETEARATNGRILGDCKCDCGNTIRVIGTQLISGYRRSCNCLSKPDRKDWVGKRFGKLVVIQYEEKTQGSHKWRCRCDCGNETVVSQSNLKSGHTRSCGCENNPTENRHLIEGTCIEMIRSKKVFSTNTSGVRGVYPVKKTGKWAAQIMFKGEKKYLGSYDTIEEAAAARHQAETVYEDFLRRYEAGEFSVEAGAFSAEAGELSDEAGKAQGSRKPDARTFMIEGKSDQESSARADYHILLKQPPRSAEHLRHDSDQKQHTESERTKELLTV